MARRARKYYLGLVTITQDAADFLRSEHGRAVPVNAAMKLLPPSTRVTGPPADVPPTCLYSNLSPEYYRIITVVLHENVTPAA